MRKYFAHIVDGNKEHDRPTGDTIIRDHPFAIDKGKTKDIEYLVRDGGGETYTLTLMGLGYKDFDDEEDYRNRAVEVIENKLNEVEEN